MRYCPECKAEYRDDVQNCTDCLVPLVSEEAFHHMKVREEQERERLTHETFVSVKVVENTSEADRIRAILEQEGITAMVRTFQDTAYDGIYVKQRGWGYVAVPESERERAEELVEEFSRAFPDNEEGKEDENTEF